MDIKYLREHPELKNDKLSLRDFTGVDLSTIPDEDWLDGLIIFRSCFEAALPGDKSVPTVFKGTFLQCNMNNRELHAECGIEDGDGIVSCNRHHAIMDNGEPYEVEKSSGYTAPIGNCLNLDLVELGIDATAGGIVATPGKRAISVIAQENIDKANNHQFVEVVPGVTINNPNYKP